MTDWERVKEVLLQNGHTCVLCKGSVMHTSDERGVLPLIAFHTSGKSYAEFSAADKTVGAGAAYMYVLLGVVAVWAKVISQDAVHILKENGIHIFYDEKVPFIINRTGDGRCPMEVCVQGAENAEEAFVRMQAVLKKINTK